MLYPALIGLAALTLAGAASAAPREPTPSESIAIGRYLVTHHCSACHSVGRRGESPNPSAPPFRHLGRRMDVDSLGEALAEGILTGHPEMPVFRFEPREVVGIVRYLRSIQADPPRAGAAHP